MINIYFRGIIICASIFLIAGISKAQVVQPERMEIEIASDENDEFLVVNGKEDGIFLLREIFDDNDRENVTWNVFHADTLLRRVWDMNYRFDNKYLLRGYDYFDGYLYILLKEEVQDKKFRVDRIDIRSQEKESFEIEFDFYISLTEFEVIQETLVLGGYVNDRPTFICFKYNEPKPIVLPGFYNDTNKILQLEMKDEQGVFNIITNYRMPDKKRSLSLRSFNADGKMLKNFDLKPQREYSLLHGSSVEVNPDQNLLVGTFATKNSDMSNGIFVAQIDSRGDHVINYYDFADLKNFFNYMKAKRELRVKKKIQRRKVKGKKTKFSYELIVHEIIEKDDEYIMIGEAVYPKYYNSGFSSYYPGYSSNRYRMAVDGYVYTHAIVVGVDKNGKIVWDNSFDIEDVIASHLDQFVHVTSSDGEIVLLYMFENVIRSKIIREGEVLDGKAYNNLKLSFEYDIVKDDDSEYGGFEDWYGNNFYAYGIQEIKNTKNEDVKFEREVFFVNKIRYE